MKPKIFLTGSTSYLGSKFIELYSDQFDILGTARTDTEHPLDLQEFDPIKKLILDFNPDFIMHVAADIGRDQNTIKDIEITNPAATQNLLEVAKILETPFIFTSTEAVYEGKENGGEYLESDELIGRGPYGRSKVLSEKHVKESGLPYLITRGHRHVGVSKHFNRPKQFPDALNDLLNGKSVHLDSTKHFKPVLINNVCDIFAHYISNDSNKQIIINLGVDKATTFYDFMNDVAKVLNIDQSLIRPDGLEAGWPDNGLVSLNKIQSLKYPFVSYNELLNTIKQDLST